MPDRLMLRLGSSGAILGGVLAVVGNVLHPSTLPHPDSEAYLTEIAGYEPWVIGHIAIFLAYVLIAAALVAVAHLVGNGSGAVWARIGLVTTAASVGLLAVLMATDGIAEKDLARAFVAAPAAERGAALYAAEALTAVNWALLSLMIMLYFGITIGLFAAAILSSRALSRWVGWWAAVAAAAMLILGLVQALGGPTQTTFGLFRVLAVAVTLWVFAIGILLWRKAVAIS